MGVPLLGNDMSVTALGKEARGIRRWIWKRWYWGPLPWFRCRHRTASLQSHTLSSVFIDIQVEVQPQAPHI